LSAGFWIQVAIPFVAGGLLSFVVERLLKPVPAFPGRPWRSFAAHLGIWTLAFCFELAFFQRPYFAAVLAVATMLSLVLISNAKFRALREPFVFQDLEYFTDMLRHPRFYLPYFGVRKILAVLAGFAVVFYLGFTLEAWLPGRTGLAQFSVGLGLLIAAGAGLLWLGTPQPLTALFEPTEDLRRHGLLASLWYYGLAERTKASLPHPSPFLIASPASSNRDRPDVVVVQSESFFDPRRLFAGIRPELLQEFDAIRARAVCQGLVEVPAWGANTARTEFAFLSALKAESLGVHRFNPYRKAARQPVPTLAGFLKAMGYRTICVHPYPASFYSRDKAFPLLGFDEFIDIESFDEAGRAGFYVGDVALAEKVCAILRERSSQPAFVFVITIENHGPLHLEQAGPDDQMCLYSQPPPEGFEDLTVYLKHLGNADRMIGMLRSRLELSPRDAWLCWYGDHVPVLSNVYQATSFEDGRTDYFIWGKKHVPRTAQVRHLKVEDLGVVFLEEAGLLMQPPMDAETGAIPTADGRR
jgi:hypothetical protein